MKKRKFISKLNFNKVKISNLNDLKGGEFAEETVPFTVCMVTCISCGQSCYEVEGDASCNIQTSLGISYQGCCPC